MWQHQRERLFRPDQVTFDDKGLVPCVVQQYDTGEVLMVCMDERGIASPYA